MLNEADRFEPIGQILIKGHDLFILLDDLKGDETRNGSGKKNIKEDHSADDLHSIVIYLQRIQQTKSGNG